MKHKYKNIDELRRIEQVLGYVSCIYMSFYDHYLKIRFLCDSHVCSCYHVLINHTLIWNIHNEMYGSDFYFKCIKKNLYSSVIPRRSHYMIYL